MVPSDSSDPLGKIVSCSCNLKFCFPGSCGSIQGSGSAGSHNKHSTELEAQASPGHSGLLMPLNQQAKKGITVLGEEINQGRLSRENWIASLQWRSFRVSLGTTEPCV